MIGASWYLLSIERETTCWLRACGDQPDCRRATFNCRADHTGFGQALNQSCPVQTPNATIFDFGIFLNALQSGVVESNDFPQKFFYCFWWGLQNLRYFSPIMMCLTMVSLKGSHGSWPYIQRQIRQRRMLTM